MGVNCWVQRLNSVHTCWYSWQTSRWQICLELGISGFPHRRCSRSAADKQLFSEVKECEILHNINQKRQRKRFGSGRKSESTMLLVEMHAKKQRSYYRGIVYVSIVQFHVNIHSWKYRCLTGSSQRCHRKNIFGSTKNPSVKEHLFLTFFIIWRTFFHHKEAFVKQKDVKSYLWNHLDIKVLLWHHEALLFLRVFFYKQVTVSSLTPEVNANSLIN